MRNRNLLEDSSEGINLKKKESRLGFGSISHNDLCQNFIPPCDDLRQLALRYRNDLRGQLEFDKYKANFKEKKAVDPRFRRERSRPVKHTTLTQSDPKFMETSQRQVQQNKVRSATTVKTLAEETPRANVLKMQPNNSQNVNMEKTDGNAVVADTTESIRPSIYATAELLTTLEDEQPKSESKEVLNEPKIVDSFCQTDAQHNDRMADAARKSKISERNGKPEINYLQEDDAKRTKVVGDIREKGDLRRSKSSILLPLAKSQLSAKSCHCKDCVWEKQQNYYTFDNFTDIDGTNYASDAGNFDKFGNLYYMGLFYSMGCFFGLFLIALIAWLLSNDTIWSWVNNINEKEKQEKSNQLLTVASYLGGAVLFSLNIVANTIYKIFVMPRSSLFNALTNNENLQQPSWLNK